MIQKSEPVRIDLSQFKLYIRITSGSELTLHFDTPSRKFYLAVIALVVHYMKQLGRIASIPMEAHRDTLILLNNTIGGAAGSTSNLLPRIYRKWKDVLCDLERASLFKVVGRKKTYEDGTGRVYHFADAEKDAWANLFEYKGSEKNVRLRLSIDRIGMHLNDVRIFYDGFVDAEAWSRFIAGLGERADKFDNHLNPDDQIASSPKSTTFTDLEIDRISLNSDKPSIAVLPFTNVSNDPDQEYFSDGMTDELISALAKLEGLKVISRTSAFYFKGEHVDLRTVGEKLKVDHVLEGSVRKAGNRVRISAQLIKVSDDTHIWADTYDRELEDVFAIQDEISQAMVKSLKVKLFGSKSEPLVKDYTKNTEAYEFFLKGLYLRGKADYKRSIEYFEKAIQIDPGYVPAYAYLANAYNSFAWMNSRPPWEIKPKINALLEKAIEIDESYGFTYVPLARYRMNEYDWPRAEKCYKCGLELNPSLNALHGAYSFYLAAVGSIEEAIQEARYAAALDPLSGFDRCLLSWWLAFNGQFEQAIKIGKEMLELDANDRFGLWAVGEVYRVKGVYEDAISIYHKLKYNANGRAYLAYCYCKVGNREEARIILDDFLKQSKKDYFSPFYIAIVYAGLNDNDKVFEWLDRAYQVQDLSQTLIKINPIFSDQHSDPRWQEVLTKRGLAD